MYICIYMYVYAYHIVESFTCSNACLRLLQILAEIILRPCVREAIGRSYDWETIQGLYVRDHTQAM